MEPAEPLNRGNCGIRATFTSVSDHCLFSRCSKQDRSGHCGCGSPKGAVVLGTEREMFSWLSVWV